MGDHFLEKQRVFPVLHHKYAALVGGTGQGYPKMKKGIYFFL